MVFQQKNPAQPRWVWLVTPLETSIRPRFCHILALAGPTINEEWPKKRSTWGMRIHVTVTKSLVQTNMYCRYIILQRMYNTRFIPYSNILQSKLPQLPQTKLNIHFWESSFWSNLGYAVGFFIWHLRHTELGLGCSWAAIHCTVQMELFLAFVDDVGRDPSETS